MSMKIGTQTASLVNHLKSRAVIGQPDPEVGMGCTLLLWTDRYPTTITEVFKVGKLTYVTVQDDTFKVVNGSTQDGSAKYEYTPNANGTKHHFRRTESGSWDEVQRNPATGRWKKSDGYGLHIGAREAYHDPHF